MTNSGKRTGTWIETYCDSQKVRSISNYKRGVLIGTYKKFDEEGMLVIKGNYRRGHKDGKWYYYNSKGDLIKKIVFSGDSVISLETRTPAKW